MTSSSTDPTERVDLDELTRLHQLVGHASTVLTDERATADLRALAETYRRLLFLARDIREGTSRLNVAVIGAFKAGKSSFVNSLLGQEVCPVDVAPTTSAVTYFSYDVVERIVDERTKRILSPTDYAVEARHPPGRASPETRSFRYYGRFRELRSIVLIDTPGFENPDAPHDSDATRDVAARADVVFFVLDAQHGAIPASTLEIILDVKARSPSEVEWVLIVNRADTQVASATHDVLKKLKADHESLFHEIIAYSAKEVFDGRNLAFEEAARRAYESILAHAAQRENFELSVAAERSEASYRARVNGQSFELSLRARADIRSNRDIVAVLERQRERKVELMRARLETSIARFENERLQVLEALKDCALQEIAGKGRDTTDTDDLLVRLRTQCDDLVLELSLDAKGAYSDAVDHGVLFRKLAKDDTKWVWSPDWGVEWDNQRARERFLEHMVEESAFQRIAGLVDALLHDVALESLPKQLTESRSMLGTQCREDAYKVLRESVDLAFTLADTSDHGKFDATRVRFVCGDAADARKKKDEVMTAFKPLEDAVSGAYVGPIVSFLEDAQRWVRSELYRRCGASDADREDANALSVRIDEMVRSWQ